MKSWIKIIALFFVSAFVLGLANEIKDDRCVENGGQIIRNSTKMNHGCIMPVGKR